MMINKETEKKTPEQIESELRQFICTENYYHNNYKYVYTDGVYYLANAAKCYWLLDEINLYQQKIHSINCKKLKRFQFWKLTTEQSRGVLVCERDTGDEVLRQEYEYTDFPLKEIRLWLCNMYLYWAYSGTNRGKYIENYGTLILPSEY